MRDLFVYAKRVVELKYLGYEYCPQTRWWWSLGDKLSVSDLTIRLNYENFIDKVLNTLEFNNYVFFNYSPMNRDIIETLYFKRFPNYKRLGDDNGSTKDF